MIDNNDDTSPSCPASGTNVTYTKQVIAQYYNFPINEAACKLGISQTQLKRICRNLNIPRWPFRRLQSLRSKLNEKEILLQRLVEERGSAAQVPNESLHTQVLALEKEISQYKELLDFIVQHPEALANDKSDERNETPAPDGNLVFVSFDPAKIEEKEKRNSISYLKSLHLQQNTQTPRPSGSTSPPLSPSKQRFSPYPFRLSPPKVQEPQSHKYDRPNRHNVETSGVFTHTEHQSVLTTAASTSMTMIQETPSGASSSVKTYHEGFTETMNRSVTASNYSSINPQCVQDSSFNSNITHASRSTSFLEFQHSSMQPVFPVDFLVNYERTRSLNPTATGDPGTVVSLTAPPTKSAQHGDGIHKMTPNIQHQRQQQLASLKLPSIPEMMKGLDSSFNSICHK